MWGILGGSGFSQWDGFETIEELSRETPFGNASSGLRKISFRGKPCIFLPRHGSFHECLPSEVNYRANIFALKKLGVTQVCSISAVGSLSQELAPGHLVVPSQYIDRTKGVRLSTFCGNGMVGHVSLAKPVWGAGTQYLKSLVPRFDFTVHFDKTYVCIEGPYFSTQAESRIYREQGAHIIGMTHFPEFALAREAGLSYLPCCFVTDYDSWDDAVPHANLAMVLQVMKQNSQKAAQIIEHLLDADIPQCDEASKGSIKSNLISSKKLDFSHHEILSVLSC